MLVSRDEWLLLRMHSDIHWSVVFSGCPGFASAGHTLTNRMCQMKKAQVDSMRPVTVCHVASGDLWAGAEAQVASLLQALNRLDDLRVTTVLLNDGRLHEVLGKAGIPVCLLEESRMSGWALLNALRTYCQENKPQIIHSHRYKEHILGALAGKLSHNPILIQTFHGLAENLRGLAAIKMKAYTWVNTFTGRLAGDGFVGVSEEIASVLKRRYPSGDVRCIRNGVDLDQVKTGMNGMAMRAGLGIPADAFVIGAVGRLTPIKGIEYLVKAAGILVKEPSKRPRKLVIAGEGPLRASLENLAHGEGIASETLFLGARTDIYDVMTMFDVLALPSLHEGIPMVLLEAMTLGVPIIATAVGGIPEILHDDREARLIPAASPVALAQALQKLETDAHLRDRLKKSARIQVESELSIGRTAQLTRDMYMELLQRRDERE